MATIATTAMPIARHGTTRRPRREPDRPSPAGPSEEPPTCPHSPRSPASPKDDARTPRPASASEAGAPSRWDTPGMLLRHATGCPLPPSTPEPSPEVADPAIAHPQAAGGAGAAAGDYRGPVALQVIGTIEPVDYQEAWDQQRAWHAQVVEGTLPDRLWLLEHPPVYTAGRRTEPFDRPVDGTPVIDVDRGGKITWHGPGQLVGYPILRLPDPIDVVAHVRRMEAMLIDVCAALGVTAGRVEGRSGVWIPADDRGGERKVAAIGVRVSRGVTMHGFALNCDPDLSWYDRIVPCGIRDATVTSLSAELGRDVTVAEARQLVLDRADALLGD